MKKLEEHSKLSLAGLSAFASSFGPRLRKGDWIELKGEMGVGKTTLFRAFMSAWNYKGVVSSPTYAIMHEFDWDDRRIIHIDAYRMEAGRHESPFDVENWADAIVFIEWFENTGLPREALKWMIQLERNEDDSRSIHIYQKE